MNNLILDGARICGKNFAGLKYKGGSRTFCAIIDNYDLAQDLIHDGWNVKKLEPRDEGGDEAFFIPVELRYDKIPPRVYVLRNRDEGEVLLNEETLGSLDDARIDYADIVIRPRVFKDDFGRDRVKAYGSVMHVVLRDDDDPFRDRYARRD